MGDYGVGVVILIMMVSVVIVAGYLIGSIPFGYIFARLAGHGDIRQIGSGHTGATNVLLVTGRKPLAALSFLFDAAKGAFAVYITLGEQPSDLPVVVFGLSAFLGHLFPIWLSFKGGQGAAVLFGMATFLAWPIGLISAAIWLAVTALLQSAVLATFTASLVSAILFGFTAHPQFALIFAIAAAVLGLRHRTELRTLLKAKILKSDPSAKPGQAEGKGD
ncbi:glycerol-3-phosphate acyltransferase [Roseibium polysiphoniae]|uniref:Glycerol-3-phosphate acyltransferase n=1 Tax=Roseibium polysiphoniae TaxID=2571221 RepID=A0A944CCH5_9HYPH|nr:glycerol-3-phosphate acyltransferase [Roseibium polysiphoniae]MBS8259917.1 glycerol-3-phosphate acyltransferase [Roseibium polysiphoniae]